MINGEHGLIRDGTRIFIIDNVMPAHRALSPSQERLITTADLQMWTMVNALERRKEDWVEPMRKADERLEVVRFLQPEGSVYSAIAVTFRQK